MRRVAVYTLFALLVGTSCQTSDESTLTSDLTGNEATYALYQASLYPVSGTVSFKEKKDGTTRIELKLSGTSGDLIHPVHLHFGNVTVENADLAATLNPVLGNSGISTTDISMLGDETAISYEDLKNMDASIKVHLAEAGPDQDIILAGGNIGSAASSLSGGRIQIAICKSE